MISLRLSDRNRSPQAASPSICRTGHPSSGSPCSAHPTSPRDTSRVAFALNRGLRRRSGSRAPAQAQVADGAGLPPVSSLNTSLSSILAASVWRVSARAPRRRATSGRGISLVGTVSCGRGRAGAASGPPIRGAQPRHAGMPCTPGRRPPARALQDTMSLAKRGGTRKCRAFAIAPEPAARQWLTPCPASTSAPPDCAARQAAACPCRPPASGRIRESPTRAGIPHRGKGGTIWSGTRGNAHPGLLAGEGGRDARRWPPSPRNGEEGTAYHPFRAP